MESENGRRGNDLMATRLYCVILVLALMPQMCAGRALSKEELAASILSARSLIHTWKVRCDREVKPTVPGQDNKEIIRTTFEGILGEGKTRYSTSKSRQFSL
jgi:hypothetical protein